MWSTPSTEEQRRYFSKHAPKRRVYGLIQTALQALHSFLAFAAWFAVFTWAFEKAPILQPFAPYLAASLLVVFHILFRVTWSTYWYDRLDRDDRTDSSIFIPIAIMAVLLFTESQGAKLFLQGQVKPPKIESTDGIYQQHSQRTADLDRQYRQQCSDIESVFRAQSAAAALPFNNKINLLRRRIINSDAERKDVNRQIFSLEQARGNALAPIAAEKAASLKRALEQATARRDEIASQAGEQTKEILNNNFAEKARFGIDMQNAGSVGWIISVVLLGLISALGYARVRINVNSGILPLRNFTVLDAHGSVIERMSTAFGDAFNRQSLRFAVWFHRIMSPREAITSFDGTVVAKPGQYNTPKGAFHPGNTPAPPPASMQLGEAYEKVFAKVQGLQAHYPGYTPGKDVLNHELAKALQMNGTYAGAEWEDPGLGK